MDPVTGGPCQGIRNLDAEMKYMGVTREVVCLDDPGANFLYHDNFKITALGAGTGLWRYKRVLIPWLKANIYRFDIVIVNGLWQYCSYATQKVLNNIKGQTGGKGGPKLLVMPHGMLDPYFQRAKERRFKAMRNYLYWHLVEKDLVNQADGLLFTSQTELLLARQTFNDYAPKMEFNVGYGINTPPTYHPDMKRAFEQQSGIEKNEAYLLFLGRIHKKKGVDLLISAYKSVLVKNPHIAKLVIAGPGIETPFGKQIRRLVSADKTLHNKVIFTGMITGDAKWGALYGADAFVLPSHQENFGIAVVEALACGTPVLISDQVNIWRDINGGGLVSADNFEGIRDMLQQWITLTAAQKKQISKRAINAYNDHFTSKAAAEKLLSAMATVTGAEYAWEPLSY